MYSRRYWGVLVASQIKSKWDYWFLLPKEFDKSEMLHWALYCVSLDKGWPAGFVYSVFAVLLVLFA